MKNVVLSIAGLAAVCAAGVARADEVQPFLLSPDSYALGGDRTYYQTGPDTVVHFGNFDLSYSMAFVMTSAAHAPPAPLSGGSNGASDGAVFIKFSLNGSPPANALVGSMHCSFFDVFDSFSHAGTWRNFNTEMLSMDMSVTTNLGPVMIRESPTLQSLGSYTVQTLPNDGGFKITSFFDIFTELSIDGGQTWRPAESSTHVELGPTVPAPGVAVLFALSGAFTMRRRRS